MLPQAPYKCIFVTSVYLFLFLDSSTPICYISSLALTTNLIISAFSIIKEDGKCRVLSFSDY